MKVVVEVDVETYEELRTYGQMLGTTPADEIAALVKYAMICRKKGLREAEQFRIGREERSVSDDCKAAGMSQAEMYAMGYTSDPGVE